MCNHFDNTDWEAWENYHNEEGKFDAAVDAAREELYEREKSGSYWAEERRDLLNRFSEELSKASGDGSRKRQRGEKPPWYEDDSHEGAIFSHLTKWKRGELRDPDSGTHPLVHAAWRCLAIACQELGNVPVPGEPRDEHPGIDRTRYHSFVTEDRPEIRVHPTFRRYNPSTGEYED
jgi:hypothetical protein